MYGELNVDEPEWIRDILTAQNNAPVKLIEILADDDSKFSMKKEAAELLEKIYSFLAGRKKYAKDKKRVREEQNEQQQKVEDFEDEEEIVYSKPKGRAPSGKTWDYSTGEWVTDEESDSESTLPKDTASKKQPKKWPRPKGRAPAGTKWDYDIGEFQLMEGYEVTPSPNKRSRHLRGKYTEID